MSNIDYQKEHEQFEKDMDVIRRAQMVLGQTYQGDLENLLTKAVEKRNIKYTKKKGKADENITITSGVGEIDEIMFQISPLKKRFLASLTNKKDETINDLWKQIYDESQLTPLKGNDLSIRYVQAGSDGKYEKVVGIELVKS